MYKRHFFLILNDALNVLKSFDTVSVSKLPIFLYREQPCHKEMLGLICRSRYVHQQPRLVRISTFYLFIDYILDQQGFHIGDSCVDSCSQVIANSFCNNNTNSCQCHASHPISIEEVACGEGMSQLAKTCTRGNCWGS